MLSSMLMRIRPPVLARLMHLVAQRGLCGAQPSRHADIAVFGDGLVGFLGGAVACAFGL